VVPANNQEEKMAIPVHKNRGTQRAVIKVRDDTGREVDFDTSVYIDADAGYSPVGKPDTTLGSLPAYYQNNNNLPITWFINFGVNGPANTQNPKKLQKAYQVTLQKAPSGKTLCIYDDTQAAAQEVLVLAPTAGAGRIAYTDNGNGTISFSLDLVDPPTGYYP
jgi:hypothetical protein